MVKVKWTDPEPVDARESQDQWYRWRTHVQWTEPWSQLAPRWRKPWTRSRVLRGVTRALAEHAAQDRDRFRDRVADLSKSRVGVSYLLPPGGDLEQFYTRVVRRMTDDLVGKGQLRPSASGAELLALLIGGDGWREAYRTAWDASADAAVAELRERVKAEVKTYFRMAEQGRTRCCRPCTTCSRRPPGRRPPNSPRPNWRSSAASPPAWCPRTSARRGPAA